ncbi:MAG: formate C-acetyltransferase/glycerol dehydratase family glycyl radical enzyme [Atopobiaceae bacterium]|jgi:formate C-acetyltransferase|nr:formate C-acetyltransferase/glycerol dehydratase family glycyl radical enzyme [Atopobiaceae bacterium]
MLTPRTQAIRASLFARPRQIDLERALLYTESWKQTEGEPVVVRRAKALRHILESHEIVIDEYDLIAGNRTRTPRAGVLSPEMSPYWILDELDLFPTRPQDTFEMSEADKRTYRDELYPYWAGRSLNDWYRANLPARAAEAQKTRIFSVAQTDKGQGHIIADLPSVLSRGLGDIAAEAHRRAEGMPGNDFYQAAVICVDATIAYVRRYEAECRRLAEAAAPARAAELLRMADTLAHVATEPARDLADALQLVWLTEVTLEHESNASSISLGRADQYLWPYYQASVAAGQGAADIRELLQCFYLKTNTIVFVRSTESAKSFAGFPSGFNLVVGGVDAEGNDASNELSRLLLDVQKDTRLPQPNLSLRVFSGTPDDLYHEAGEVIRLGDGIPQVFNDEVNVPAFMRRGVSLADARDYAVVGCVELSIPGRMYGLHDISMFNMVRCLEIAMHARPHGYESFDALEDAVEKTIDAYVGLMAEGCNACDEAHRETSPTPLLSVLVADSMEKGADITAGGARYNPSGVQGVGTANLADSLYAIKRAVFEEKALSWEDLLAMLDRDWSGAGDEAWRQRLVTRYPKYGNDVDEVDEIGRRFLEHYGREVECHANPRGGRFQPGSYTVSAHIPLGEACGATPDGRHAHEQLADGGLSPMVGRDTHGPTASLRSVSKLDNVLDSNGSLLNVKFSPSTLAGERGLAKLEAYLRAFSRLHIQHIQFNVVDRATLLDAQAHPEDHADLVVRVAGYSAMFVELSKAVQDDIINRTEHVL